MPAPKPCTTLLLLPVLLIGMMLGGCSSVEDHLTLNADGSGTVVIKTTRLNDALDTLLMQRGMMMEQMPEMLYPPMTAEEAEVLFPGDGFTIDEQSEEAEDTTTTTLKVSFKDINDLLASPYGKVHAMAIHADKQAGRLTVRCRGGLQAMGAMLTAIKQEDAEEAADDMELELEQIESLEAGFNFRFTLTLPNPVTADDAAQTRDATAVWLHARSDYETREAFSESLQRLITVSCDIEGISFTPNTPLRLALDNFEDLKVEDRAEPSGKKAVDPEEVLAGAEVKPLVVMLKRTSNYTGQGWGDENYGRVVACVTLPKALQPLRWGEFQTEELTDDQGGDLVPDEDERSYRFGYGMDLNEDFGWYGRDNDAQPDRVVRYVNIPFKTPDISAQSITSISGTIKAMYGGRPVLIKLPNAIESINDQEMGFSYSNDGDSAIDNPALQQANLQLYVRGAMANGPGVMLMLGAESEDTLIKEIQVFDAQGRPCPTLREPGYSSDGEQNLQVMVIGKPQPPLSLALMVDAATTSVQIPMRFNDLPLSPLKEKEGE